MTSTINTWLIRVFCIFWAMFLFIDYAANSGYLTQAFSYFKYSGLLITTTILSGALAYLFVSRKKPGFLIEIKNYRNIYSYFFLLLYMGLIMLFYVNQTEITTAKGGAVILFLAKSFGFQLAIIFVLTAAYSCGSFILSKTGIFISTISGFFISLAIGFALLVFGLFILGLSGMLNQIAVILLLLGMIITGWKNILPFIKNNITKKIPTFEVHAIAIIPFALIIFMVALNLSYITRPFPIGFDDLNLYMNAPKLIAGYGALTQGGDAYNWSLIMSLGFIIYKSATIAMLLSVLPGILSILVLYQIARQLSVSRTRALLACSLFYTLPNIIWQSRNDAKVDLALLFITLCGVLLLLEFYFSKTKQNSTVKLGGKFVDTEFILWSLCGLLVGFAFGIKYTSLLSIFAFLVFIFYVTAGKWAAIGMFFLNFAIIFGLKLTRFAAFDADSVFLTITPLILSVGFFALAFKGNVALVLKSAKIAFVFCFIIGITFIPWAAKNISEHKSISLDAMLTGKSPLPVLYPEMKGALGIHNSEQSANSITAHYSEIKPKTKSALLWFADLTPLNLFADASQPSNTLSERPAEKRDIKYTDKYEEIRRYLGYEKGFIRFISLPYDLAMKTNVRLWSADTGILLLILLPLFMLVYDGRHLIKNIFKMLLLLLFLIVSIISVNTFTAPFELDKALELVKTSSFIESESFKNLFFPTYFFMKKILLATGNILMPVYKTLSFQTVGFSFMLVMFSSFLIWLVYKKSMINLTTKSKSLIAFTFCILISWMILSSGIFWYGMVGFSLLMIVIAIFSEKLSLTNDFNSKFANLFITICTGLWFVLILPFQFMPVKFTIVKDMTQVDFNAFIDRPFAKFAIGTATEKEVFRQFFQPAEQSILNVVNADKKAGILNVSTFLTYHITNNDQRVYVDNQLGIFDKVYRTAKEDKQEVLNELKRKGIKYILVSLYTPTLDMTPEKSLTKKYTNMMQLLVNNPGAKLLFTNRVVQRPDGNMPWTVDGQQVRAMYHLAGMRMLNQGSVAMFEIL